MTDSGPRASTIPEPTVDGLLAFSFGLINALGGGSLAGAAAGLALLTATEQTPNALAFMQIAVSIGLAVAARVAANGAARSDDAWVQGLGRVGMILTWIGVTATFFSAAGQAVLLSQSF